MRKAGVHVTRIKIRAGSAGLDTRMLDLTALLDGLGEPQTAALLGLITGPVFGIAAQQSRFCLRAATVEFAHGRMGPRVAVWLLTFSTAIV